MANKKEIDKLNKPKCFEYNEHLGSCAWAYICKECGTVEIISDNKWDNGI